MMHNLVGIGLFVGGALAGSIFTKFVLDRAYEERFQNEKDDILQMYMKRGDKQGQHHERVQADAEKWGMERLENYIAQTTRYQTVASDHEAPGEVEVEDNVRAYFSPPEDVPGEAYVIDVDSYTNECDHFSKETVFYYDEDETLCDEDEEIITDIRGVVGSQALTSFGVDGSDMDVVYVRNERLRIDYEIIREPKSYSVEVMGIVNPDLPRKKRPYDE